MSHRFGYLANTLLLRTIPVVHPFWSRSEWRIVRRFLMGEDFEPAVEQLEREVCRLTGARYALAVNLGRSAIQAALEGLSFPPGSEVIVPTFACTGVIMPVVQAGLQPVLVDMDADFNVSIESIHEAISDKTRAVILPHLGGKFARGTGDLLALAKQRGLRIIDDACQAFGLQIEGRWAGTFGDAGVFSFGGGKTLFGPGGGMLVTNDESIVAQRAHSLSPEGRAQVYRRIARFAWRYGLQRATFPVTLITEQIRSRFGQRGAASSKDTLARYAYPVCRMAGVEAALALAQVRRYQQVVTRNQANAAVLLASDLPSRAALRLPDPSAHIFTKFLVSTGDDAAKAQTLQRQLRRRGIEVGTLYTPLHLRSPFRSFRRARTVETEKHWRGVFEVPVHASLTATHMKRLTAALADANRASTRAHLRMGVARIGGMNRDV